MLTNCESCNSFFACNFLNNTCQNEDLYGIRYESYRANIDYVNCIGANDYDYLHLDRDIKSYTLGHQDSNQFEGFPVCQWTIKTDPTEKLEFRLNRDLHHHQDFFIEVQRLNGIKVFDSKSLSDCSGHGMLLELYQTSKVIIRSKILNENSDYRIVISSHEVPLATNMAAWVFITSTVGFIITLFIGAMCYMVYTSIKQTTRSRSRHFSRLHKKAKVRAHRALNHMISGKYSNLSLKYNEHACAICLEPYTSHSDIHITKHCNHSFHSTCILKSCERFKLEQVMRCPSCNTELSSSRNGSRYSSTTNYLELVTMKFQQKNYTQVNSTDRSIS